MTSQSIPYFLNECCQILGNSNVMTRQEDMEKYLTDWRKQYKGSACAVLKPASTNEVQAIVQSAAKHKIALVPQGGNTGLSGGATPNQSGEQAIISFTQMNKIEFIDLQNDTITVEAGVILEEIQKVAEINNRFFPLNLGAKGSCTIGGNLSTNAGGTNVLRYGNARDLCLGLEVITATGECWNGLRGLRKDNTGYDLKDLFIGAEGTLGIITKAVLKLYPKPNCVSTVLVTVTSLKKAIALLMDTKEKAGHLLTAFEFMSSSCLKLLKSSPTKMDLPIDQNKSAVLIELSGFDPQISYKNENEKSVGSLVESNSTEEIILSILSQHEEDSLIAQNEAQAKKFWQLRESIPLAQAAKGLNIKHDIGLPISNLSAFVEKTNEIIEKQFPNIEMVIFGHLGDGNLHYNVQAPYHIDSHSFLVNNQRAINRLIYDNVQAYKGTISAEHGIGQLKCEEMKRYKSPIEIKLMEAIKRALDPNGIMNPGKVFTAE